MNRDDAIERIRKCLAMAEDGRGSPEEAATAARQAQKLMEKFQVDRSEAVLEELAKGDELIQEWVRPDYQDNGVPYKTVATWVGVLGLGVAVFTQTKVDIRHHLKGGCGLVFSGYAPDVEFAKWLFMYLLEAAQRNQRILFPKGLSRATGTSFRRGFASAVQVKLQQMAADAQKERQGLSRDGAGTALVIYDAKKDAVARAFGEQKIKNTSGTVSDGMAYHAGREAGSNVSINRAITGTQARKQVR